ncbi:MAG TPA: CorA family divalent cation transporter [Mycobacteriales bacterium]|nr:CorA family divalent cation transporter [Mycobacteriales bacterium]
MDVWHVTQQGARAHQPADVPGLLERSDGFVWVDVPQWDDEAERLLGPVLELHPVAVQTCARRNYLPSAFPYPQHVLLVFLGVLRGAEGHVHLLELDVLLSERYLVTVHGPVNPAVPAEAPQREVVSALRRMEAGRFHPTSPADVLQDLLGAMGRHQAEAMGEVTSDVARLEQRVRDGDLRDPEPLMDEMFLLRHELQVVLTVAGQTQELLSYVGQTGQGAPLQRQAQELAAQFGAVRRSGESEREYLLGVIELYQTRVSTKMTVAAERLAVLAALTLPVTAVSSVVGMNVIVNQRTRPAELVLLLLLMLAISGVLLRWTRKQGWW